MSLTAGRTPPSVAAARQVNAYRGHAALRALHLLLRLGLGVLFVFSGWSKLQDPQYFAFSIKAFKLGLPDAAVVRLAYGIPWLELLSGAAIVAGAWLRPAAVVIAGLMALFGGAVVSLLVRGLDVHCACFGAYSFVCEGPLGICHLARNVALGLLAVLLAWSGPGPLALAADRRRPG